MKRGNSIRNVYEELPDELKAILTESNKGTGGHPESAVSRETLVQDHEWHLRFLDDVVLQPQYLILPPPYPPARVTALIPRLIRLRDLRVGMRHETQLLFVRIITEPYVYSTSVTIVEDEYGDAARLTVGNLDDTMIDSTLEKGSVLAIWQPCWTRVPGGGFHIRVDHPSDLVFVSKHDEQTPPAWRSNTDLVEGTDAVSWKQQGDLLFLEKKFRKALRLYDRSLDVLRKFPNPTTELDLYRKRCGVNLVLLRFDAAAEDLAKAITLFAESSTALHFLDCTDRRKINHWLHSHSNQDPHNITSQLPRSLKDLAIRIRFDLGLHQSTPEYDLTRFLSYVGPLTIHVDAASYVRDAKVMQTAKHGRGLFAARDFRTGDLIMAEKAFALPGYFFNDRSSECSLYSLGDETATDKAGALLFKELVQKLRQNPSQRRAFFDLDDGGYWEKYGWDVEEGHDIPVDVFRVEHIRRRNCFSAPLRSLDFLTIPSPVRNGFWIHSSYANHACLPNSVRTFIGDMLLLRASRDIHMGEEITSQYFAPELTYEARQKIFKGTWGFVCDCVLCFNDKRLGAHLERERMAIFEELKGVAQKLGSNTTVTALKRFTKRLRDLEALYDGDVYADLPRLCLVHPTLFLTEAWRTLRNLDKTIEFSIKLLKHFAIHTKTDGNTFQVVTNAGLVNIEAMRALKYIAEAYAAKGRVSLAEAIRATARVWFRVITGADIGFGEFMKA